MHAATTSYRKTIIASAIAGLVVIAMTQASQTLVSAILPSAFLVFLSAFGWVVGLLLLLVALGGLLINFRYVRRERGEEDLFFTLNSARSEAVALEQTVFFKAIPFPRLRRWLGAPAYLVNDTVRIRSLPEISATLDANGCLDGLPFMPEMAKYCGSVATVFRCVDKIYDYGGKKDMRRLKDTVLLAGLRCDGGAHDGCQAQCYILWKTAWITMTNAPTTLGVEPSVKPTVAVPSASGINPSIGPTRVKDNDAGEGRYVCQYTELVRASTSMGTWDPRQELRPLIAGNVTVSAFAVAMLTRLFNAVQRLRGGTTFPPVSPQSFSSASPPVDLNLQPGELVRVRNPEDIFETLNQSGRNRGLRFDRAMLSYCKRRYRVLSRVDKLIDDATGRMLRMKTPCIVLDGADFSGEHARFLAQHDYPFWREAWLERVDRGAQPETSPPLVTIGVPVYNGERFLAQCLDSLLAQTFQDFVLLISDNASTDRTEEICQRYVKADARVRYHRNETNIGLYGNFNLLLRTARTRYVKLASADDFWAPTMLSDAVAAMENDPSLVMCYSKAVLIDQDGREIRRYDNPLQLMDTDPVVRFKSVLMDIGLVNQIVGLIRIPVVWSALPLMSQTGADTVFVAELSLYGKIREIPEYQYFRRFHEQSSSWDRSSEAHQVKSVLGQGAHRIRLAAWKTHGGFVRRLLHSPLGYGPKLRLLLFLGRRMVWDRSQLLKECWQLMSDLRTLRHSETRKAEP